MAFKEIKGVSSTQIIQYITSVKHVCDCSLSQEGFSPLLLTSGRLYTIGGNIEQY